MSARRLRRLAGLLLVFAVAAGLVGVVVMASEPADAIEVTTDVIDWQ